MLEKFRERRNEESGFTLVELLVVMLILGILAAIAVPAFFSQRDKARDADAKAAVRTAETAAEAYATDNGGVFLGTAPVTVAKMVAIEPSLAGANLSIGTTPPLAARNIDLVVTSDTGSIFHIKKTGGVKSLTCSPAGGGCPESLIWDGGS